MSPLPRVCWWQHGCLLRHNACPVGGLKEELRNPYSSTTMCKYSCFTLIVGGDATVAHGGGGNATAVVGNGGDGIGDE